MAKVAAPPEHDSPDELSERDVAEIATSSLDAAAHGFEKAVGDPGLQYSFFLLTQLVLAARSDEWRSHLEEVGIKLDSTSGILDLTTEVQASVDEYVLGKGHPTDVSEFAQRALGQALSETAGGVSANLFAGDPEELRGALRTYSTKRGFSELGQKFFASFMANFLNFYLSRITASKVGRSSLKDTQDLSRFNANLTSHCEQSAQIVKSFCGEWYSKTEFKEGITVENTSRFMAVALQKLAAEMRRQKEVA